MLEANKLRIGSKVYYTGDQEEGKMICTVDAEDIDNISTNWNGNNDVHEPIPITLFTLAKCNPFQMNKISDLLQVGFGGQEKDPKEFTIVVKHTGRQMKFIHEIQNFYEANTGEELSYLEC